MIVPIWKADMLRYILLFAEGGVYNDLDVSCVEPIANWIPAEFGDEPSVVAGWEFDYGIGDNFIHEFASWTIMSKPRSPHMWAVIEDILDTIKAVMAENNLAVGELTMDMLGDVVDATGPRRLTRSIIRSVADKLNTTVDEVQSEIEFLEVPKMVDDVLVLPGWAFAFGANDFEETFEWTPGPYVQHHYAGTWKNEKGGETKRRRGWSLW